MNHKSLAALRAAFPLTLPICAAFLFLGMSYGVLTVSKGFSVWYPFGMSLLIFAGSMEFVTVGLLLAPFDPLKVFMVALMINFRHVFYGLSMLEPFKNLGWQKPYLIFGMCDESFTINCSAPIAPEIDRGWFMFFVTLLNHFYWVAGATLGGLLGTACNFNTTGLDFVLAALFLSVFVSQWQSSENHYPALSGLVISALCLALFGAQNFLLPAMTLIAALFIYTYYHGGRTA